MCFLLFIFFVLALSDAYRCMENVAVFKSFPNNVCCCNCGRVVGDIDRTNNRVTLTSFRIMRVAPYEFDQICRMRVEYPGHAHTFGSWSKLLRGDNRMRITAIYNFYCRTRRLIGPCRFSPGKRSLFFAGIDVQHAASDVESASDNEDKMDVVENIDSLAIAGPSCESTPVEFSKVINFDFNQSVQTLTGGNSKIDSNPVVDSLVSIYYVKCICVLFFVVVVKKLFLVDLFFLLFLFFVI